MSPTKTKNNDSPKVTQAEQSVKESTNEFQTAMEHLEEKVQGTAQNIKHVEEVVRKPKQMVQDLISSAKDKVVPIWQKTRTSGNQLLEKSRESSQRVARQVKEHPTPFAIGILTITVG